MQNLQNSENSLDKEEQINVKQLFEKYLFFWKWFVLTVFVSLIIAFIFIRYSTPEYVTSATILIKDDKKGGIASELSAFADLGVLGGVKSNVDNEIEILKARTLVKNTIKQLDLNVSYFVA
ncbi:MAG: Wzz/FepE/Etk N-terminal domain-containing protein, partial [Bacteroidota bacterium]